VYTKNLKVSHCFSWYPHPVSTFNPSWTIIVNDCKSHPKKCPNHYNVRSMPLPNVIIRFLRQVQKKQRMPIQACPNGFCRFGGYPSLASGSPPFGENSWSLQKWPKVPAYMGPESVRLYGIDIWGARIQERPLQKHGGTPYAQTLHSSQITFSKTLTADAKVGACSCPMLVLHDRFTSGSHSTITSSVTWPCCSSSRL